MTSQILILNKKKSYAVSDSVVTIDDCKTYDGEQKIFEISQELSTILLLSGNSRFAGQSIKNFIDEYVSKTDFKTINTVNEIKDTFNDCISESTQKCNVDEYVHDTFIDFEKNMKKLIKNSDKESLIENLKSNSFCTDIDFLKDNSLLNSKITKLANLLLNINSKNEFNCMKHYLTRNYYAFLINNSPNIVLMGYDKCNNNPTYFNYNILANINGKLEIHDEYSVTDCKSTMIFTIAQDSDIELNLTGFNDNSLNNIQRILFEFFNENNILTMIDANDWITFKERLKLKIYNYKLNNLKSIIEYIEVLPDTEILKLLDVLVELTSIKMKFSNGIHSVGGKRIKVVLSKYCGVKFVEW